MLGAHEKLRTHDPSPHEFCIQHEIDFTRTAEDPQKIPRKIRVGPRRDATFFPTPGVINLFHSSCMYVCMYIFKGFAPCRRPLRSKANS